MRCSTRCVASGTSSSVGTRSEAGALSFGGVTMTLARTAQRETAGTGLGLSIVRALVEAYAGRTVAENRKSGGARFVVELTAPLPTD